MAKAHGVSNASVARIWRAHGLQPHRVRRFKLSRDPRFADRGARRAHQADLDHALARWTATREAFALAAAKLPLRTVFVFRQMG